MAKNDPEYERGFTDGFNAGSTGIKATSDADQLIELRKISGLALSMLRRLIGTLDNRSQRGMAEDAEAIANQLYKVLNPSHSQEKETR